MLKLLFIKIFITLSLKFTLLEAAESTTTTLSLIQDYGYFAETHQAITEDGYILTMFRLPYSPKNKSNAEDPFRPVVFIMHGIFESSSDWVLSGYPRSLAFLLSDAGYDVWLGNARGTRYSKEHIYLKTSEAAFWDFSWHEIGIYDLPACVDYILETTSTSKLQYIGFSQGTTSFSVAASSLPDFNDKIQSAHLMAPVIFASHAPGLALPALALILSHPFPYETRFFELFPSSRIFQIGDKIVCDDRSWVKAICELSISLLTGWNSVHTNSTALEIYYETAPAGTSIKQLIHYLQLYKSGRFCQFDYGREDNFRVYKQINPPDYPLEKISAPLYLYHGENDALGDPEDVEIYENTLSPNALKKSYLIPYTSWNHGDFVYGNNVDEVVYSVVMDDLKVGAAL